MAIKNSTPKNLRSLIFPAGALLIGIGAGLVIGTSNQPEPRVETVIETVTKEVTPDVCLNALDFADDVNDATVQGFTIVAEIFDAASTFDVTGMNAGNERLDQVRITHLQPSITKYQSAATTCRNQ